MTKKINLALLLMLIRVGLYAQCLTGVYKIGGVNADFNDFTSATTALQQNGVCGPVNFKIATGMYTESINIPKTNGVSSINTITFESESGDSLSVIISTNKKVVMEVNSSNVMIRNISLWHVGGDLTRPPAIRLSDSVQNITIKNCSFKEDQGTAIFMEFATQAPHLTISNNHFVSVNFSTGINVSNKIGQANYGRGLMVSNNFFDEFSDAIRVSRMDSITVKANRIRSQSGGTAIGVEETINYTISRNEITGFFSNAILVRDNSNPIETHLISNNFIIGRMYRGINLQYSDNCMILFNTIHITEKENVALYLYSSSNNTVKNNILNASAYAQLIYNVPPTLNNVIDYNNYFSLSDSMFASEGVKVVYYDLAKWKQMGNTDQHSLNFKPQFVSPVNFHLNDYNINNKGIATSVTDDFDGQTRETIPDIGADEFFLTPLANDAGLAAYDTTASCKGSPKSIIFKLYNNGSAVLTSVVIKWTSDGNVQPAYTWNGSIAPGGFKYIEVGTLAVTSAGQKIISYVDLVNGVADLNKSNDTCMYARLRSSLSGNYTIGGNAPDFNSLTAALDYVKKTGICGSVVFTIRKGTYKSNLLFENIKGLSRTSTITFQSESSDVNDVQIVNDVSTDATIQFAEMSFIKFKDVTVKGSTTFPVEIVSTSTNLSFEHVYFKGTRFLSSNNDDVNLSFSKCLFDCALVIGESSSIKFKKNISVTDCIFNSMNGITLSSVDSATISGNKFNWGTMSPDLYNPAIRIVRGGYIEIVKNFIKGEFTHGITLERAGNRGTINVTNNVVVGGAYTTNLIACGNVENVNIRFNTCIAMATKVVWPVSIVTDHTNGGLTVNLRVFNNVFYNNGAGPVMYMNSNTGITLMNHNVFYTKGTYEVNYSDAPVTFTNYRNTTGFDKASAYGDPLFLSDTVYRISNDTIRGKAIPVAGVTDDFENRIRNASTPTAGAYETTPDTIYEYKRKDLEALSTIQALKKGENAISVLVKNNAVPPLSPYIATVGTIDTIAFSYQLNNAAWVSEQWTGNLQVNAMMTYNFTTKLNIDQGNIYQLKVRALVRGTSVDLNPSNNMVSVTDTLPMEGTYYVGGYREGFKDLETAMSTLKICHAAKEVKFLILGGPYYLLNLEGNDTISFVGDSLTYPMIHVNRIHASNLTFDKVSLGLHNDVVGQTYDYSGTEVYTTGFTMDSCFVYAITPHAGIMHNGLCFLNSSNVTITNNNFMVGLQAAIVYNGLRDVNGCTGDWGAHHYISHNRFFGRTAIALYSGKDNTYGPVDPPDSIRFHDNFITQGDNGIDINSHHQALMKIYNNQVGTYVQTPMVIKHVPNAIPIYNNFFSSKYKATSDPLSFSTAVELIRTANHQLVNNSVYGTVLIQNSQAITLRNNVMYDPEHPVLVTDDSSTYLSDFNNYYSNGLVIGLYKHAAGLAQLKNLDSLKKQMGMDQHSLSVHPYYVSVDDLHSNSRFLKNKGTPHAYVTIDIDGQQRNLTAPDMGADEINLLPDGVWPGDTDADSRVDNKDLLAIGVYNGSSGLARTSVSNDWLAQTSTDWAQQQQSGVNLKHADCNGDGTIDDNDTLAITTNFGLFHSTNTRVSNNGKTVSIGNDLYFIMPTHKSSYNYGDKIYVEVWLGKSVLPVADAYGIAFDVVIGTDSILPGSFKLAMVDGWLGTPRKDAYVFSKTNDKTGRGDAAIARKNHVNVSGYGRIATISFIYNGKKPVTNLPLIFEEVMLINANGMELNVKVHQNNATNYTQDIPTGISGATNPQLALGVAPNPFSADTRIRYEINTDGLIQLELINGLGQTLALLVNEQQTKGIYELNFNTVEAALPQGVYMLKLSNGNAATFQKVVVTD